MISVKQVPKAPTYAVLLVYGEVNAEREEEGSSKRAGKGLLIFPSAVVYKVHLRQ